MKRLLVLSVLALCLACSGGGGGGGGSTPPAPVTVPLISSTAASPALADWSAGQALTLSWTLGGGAPSLVTLAHDGRTMMGWNQAGGTPAPTSFSFTPTWQEVQEPWELMVTNDLGAATASWTIPATGFQPTTTTLVGGVATVSVDGSTATTAAGTVTFYHFMSGGSSWTPTGAVALANGTATDPGHPAGTVLGAYAVYSGDTLRQGSSSPVPPL